MKLTVKGWAIMYENAIICAETYGAYGHYTIPESAKGALSMRMIHKGDRIVPCTITYDDGKKVKR